jgi:phage baseplate assembly protein W
MKPEVLNSITDLNTSYLTGFKANDLIVTGTDAINQQILNLLSTSPKDILFQPELGSMLEYYLFEPIDTNTAYNIKIWVLEALERWLPFITMLPEESSVIPDLQNQSYNIRITYRVNGTDVISNVLAQFSRSM